MTIIPRTAILVLTLALASAASSQGPTGTMRVEDITGVVVRFGTSEPIDGVTISIKTGQLRPKTAVTDTAGRFIFPQMPLDGSRWSITVQKAGYITPPQGAGPETVVLSGMVSETLRKNLRFELIPGGGISGLVVDLANRPAVRMPVVALRVTYRAGHAVLEQAGIVRTDERGEYRFLGLPPGAYLVRAEPEEDVLPTYYPSATAPTAAVLLTLNESDERSGVQIGLLNTPPIRISGRIVAGNDRAPISTNATTLYLLPRDSVSALVARMNSFANSAPATEKIRGGFEIRGVPPGEYDLYAVIPGPPAASVAHAVVDAVPGRPADNITVVVRAEGATVSGVLKLEGPGSMTLTRLKVALEFKDNPDAGFLSRFVQEAPVDANGTFTLKRVPDGLYRLRISGDLPPSAYVADLRVAGSSIFGRGLRIDGGQATPAITMILNRGGTRLAGFVKSQNGAQAGKVTVALIPDPARRTILDLYKTAVTNADGSFFFEGVPPGEFSLFAWERLATGGEYLTPGFVERFEALGTKLTVTQPANEGARIDRLNVTLIQAP